MYECKKITKKMQSKSKFKGHLIGRWRVRSTWGQSHSASPDILADIDHAPDAEGVCLHHLRGAIAHLPARL